MRQLHTGKDIRTHGRSIPVAHDGNSCRLVMSMGNYLGIQDLPPSVMAARNQPLGFDHPTVVPANFEPDDQQELGEEESESAERE